MDMCTHLQLVLPCRIACSGLCVQLQETCCPALHVCSRMLCTDAGSPMLIEIPSALLKQGSHHFLLQSHLDGGLMSLEPHSRQGLQRHRVKIIMAEGDLSCRTCTICLGVSCSNSVSSCNPLQPHEYHQQQGKSICLVLDCTAQSMVTWLWT